MFAAGGIRCLHVHVKSVAWTRSPWASGCGASKNPAVASTCAARAPGGCTGSGAIRARQFRPCPTWRGPTLAGWEPSGPGAGARLSPTARTHANSLNVSALCLVRRGPLWAGRDPLGPKRAGIPQENGKVRRTASPGRHADLSPWLSRGPLTRSPRPPTMARDAGPARSWSSSRIRAARAGRSRSSCSSKPAAGRRTRTPPHESRALRPGVDGRAGGEVRAVVAVVNGNPNIPTDGN